MRQYIYKVIRDLADRITERLKLPLPGERAQLRMSATMKTKRLRFRAGSDAREGGVLILLYPDDTGRVCLPLMERPPYDGAHGGQISFPGGKTETYDRDRVETALREAWEEIGIDRESVKILGTLTELFIPASNFSVLPVVGYVDEKPIFQPNKNEVEKLIEAQLNHITHVEGKKTRQIIVRNTYRLEAPYYDIDGHVVWGATAMMLSEFEDILRDVGIG